MENGRSSSCDAVEENPTLCPVMEEILIRRKALANELKCTKEKLQSCLSILEGPISEQLDEEQDKYKEIENVLCKAGQNINKIGNDFKSSLESLQEQISIANENINSVRKLNEIIKCNVSCLTDNLNNENSELKSSPASCEGRVENNGSVTEICPRCKSQSNIEDKADICASRETSGLDFKEEKPKVNDNCANADKTESQCSRCYQYYNDYNTAITKLKDFIDELSDEEEACCEEAEKTISVTTSTLEDIVCYIENKLNESNNKSSNVCSTCCQPTRETKVKSCCQHTKEIKKETCCPRAKANKNHNFY